MRRLLLLGLNHTTAPIEVREKLAFAHQQGLHAITELQKHLPGSEVVLLSTCNRVEIYAAAPKIIERDAMEQFLSDFHTLPRDRFSSHLYEKRGRDVVQHLFNVVSSLDSMVLGETQILGQVRNAYEIARTSGITGSFLNPLFQRAVTVGKQVLTETGLGEGRVSVGSVAVDYARRIFDSFGNKTVLCVGTGEMAHLVLHSFVELKPGNLLVASRSVERANEVAREFNGQGVSSEDIDQHLTVADIVISATGHPTPLITRQRLLSLMKARRYRPLFLIDIAVPRDIEPSAGDIEGVYLYNLDDLQEVVQQTLAQRSEVVDQAQKIVHSHVEAFLTWHRQREIGPMIDQLYKRYSAIAQSELERSSPKMSLNEQQEKELKSLVHRIVHKMLHDPVSQLRESNHPDGGGYVHAVERLFKLTPPPQTPEKSDDVDDVTE